MGKKKIESYTVFEEVERSSKSLVYRARSDAGEPVFLKVLRSDYPSPQELMSYRREYELLLELDGKGVVRAYSLESWQNTLVMVLEDFGAESLRRILQRQSLSLEQCLELGIAITEALGEVHTRGIIHRDINPANIIWNQETGELKLIDFGIALTLAQQKTLPAIPSQLAGTLAYISPEQTGRTNRSIDYGTDFYALGVTLYEMLAGECPFTATDTMELVHAHLASEPLSPSVKNPAVPAMVSQIVLKLMAKGAEERYQSTHGLGADLKRCLKQLRRSGQVEPFTLASRDVRQRLRIPQRLYGRDKPLETLMDCFERVARGGRELMLVAGKAGVGKSALVQSLYRPLTGERGHFASGKFGQYQRDIPYRAISAAVRELVEELVALEEVELDGWKQRIQQAVEPNGQLLVDLIPEVEWLIGPQPSVVPMEPSQAQLVQMKVFREFIGVCCGPGRPLVLFVDDLQWADPASLRLLEGLLTDELIAHLLVLGAYGDNELSASHRLISMLDGLKKQQQNMDQITLGPLGEEDVRNLLVDTVQQSGQAVEELAA